MTGLFLGDPSALTIAEHKVSVEAIRSALAEAAPETIVRIELTGENVSSPIFGVRLRLQANLEDLRLASAWIAARVQDSLPNLDDDAVVGLLSDEKILPLEQFSIKHPEPMIIAWGRSAEQAINIVTLAASSFDRSLFDQDGYLKQARTA